MFGADTDSWTARTRPPWPWRRLATGRCHTIDAWWKAPRYTAVDNSDLGGRNEKVVRRVGTGMRGSARSRWAKLGVGAVDAAVRTDSKAT